MKFYRAISDYIKFINLKKNNRKLVVYSEGKEYFPHLFPIVYELSKNKIDVCYLTSDYEEKIPESPYIRRFFIGKGIVRTLFFQNLETIVCLMTMPDLDSFHIKKSKRVNKYVYIFHSCVSTHMIYRYNAFTAYDIIFCVGPHHKKEIRQFERIEGLRKKQLFSYGYNRLDSIIAATKNNKKRVNKYTRILIAPSWGKKNLINLCGLSLIKSLLEENYKIVLRPHPRSFIEDKKIIKDIKNSFLSNSKFIIDEDVVDESGLDDSDVLITDWSGVAMDFAFGKERPVIFIDSPRKINNSLYKKLNIDPIEVFIRQEVGVICDLDDVNKISRKIRYLEANQTLYLNKIRKAKNNYIYNIGISSKVGAKEIMKQLNREY